MSKGEAKAIGNATIQPITDEAIAELRRLHEAATQGVWSSCDDIAPRLHLYVEPAFSGEPVEYLGSTYCDTTGKGRANLKAICAAHNALPSLLSEVDRLRKENAELRPTYEAAIVLKAKYHLLTMHLGPRTASEIRAATRETDAALVALLESVPAGTSAAAEEGASR